MSQPSLIFRFAGLFAAIAIFSVFSAPPSARAQADQWDDLLANSQWYVPAENLLAYLSVGDDFSNPLALADQTLWNITSVQSGILSGSSVAQLKIGQVESQSSSTMNGVVTPGGQIRILFTQDAGPTTVGIGQMQQIEGVTYMQMQMITGSDGAYVTHWAYMAKYEEGSTTLPDLEIESSLRSEEWNWMLNTSWSFENPELFDGGTGLFEVDGYRNGYFWGTGTGPQGSGTESYTLMGSVTPQGNVLFNLMNEGTLISLTGQITGSAADGAMVLRSYDGSESLGEAGYATVVPEPSTWLAFLLGGCVLIGYRRLRRSGPVR